LCKLHEYFIGVGIDTAYTVGLLQGLGKIVINTYYVENGFVYEMAGLRSVTPEEEYAALGFTHPQVASTLLKKWNFLPEIGIPIEYHLNPIYAPKPYTLTSIVLNLGLEALNFFLEDPDQQYSIFDPDRRLMDRVGLTTTDLIASVRDAINETDAIIANL